ncbi:hypothetical protein [Lacipirellula parvula]|uniref:Uncharacterized protein n=1 Tax=Lacipirellula parvula TaxID=2650471 RepID=A0A5K7XCD6_9BACT|nr:hypothetical protein [Lacipirellula parvula]BBO34490.1 hypothetical protein PLANPX_4102 [Lacipirellula parvula]
MPTRAITDRSGRSLRRAIVDFAVAWVTLTCSVFVAFGLASFFHAVPARPFSDLTLTTMERALSTGIYAAIALAGFIYMLWRQEWRLRTFDMLAITAYWVGVCLIAAVDWPESSFIGAIFFVWVLNAVQFTATLFWVQRVANRQPKQPSTE